MFLFRRHTRSSSSVLSAPTTRRERERSSARTNGTNETNEANEGEGRKYNSDRAIGVGRNKTSSAGSGSTHSKKPNKKWNPDERSTASMKSNQSNKSNKSNSSSNKKKEGKNTRTNQPTGAATSVTKNKQKKKSNSHEQQVRNDERKIGHGMEKALSSPSLSHNTKENQLQRSQARKSASDVRPKKDSTAWDEQDDTKVQINSNNKDEDGPDDFVLEEEGQITTAKNENNKDDKNSWVSKAKNRFFGKIRAPTKKSLEWEEVEMPDRLSAMFQVVASADFHNMEEEDSDDDDGNNGSNSSSNNNAISDVTNKQQQEDRALVQLEVKSFCESIPEEEDDDGDDDDDEDEDEENTKKPSPNVQQNSDPVSKKAGSVGSSVSPPAPTNDSCQAAAVAEEEDDPGPTTNDAKSGSDVVVVVGGRTTSNGETKNVPYANERAIRIP